MTSLPILLPDGFIPVVSVGDTITVDQSIAEKNNSETTVVINISEELSLPPEKTGKTVKKNPGDVIEPGDIIAYRRGFLKMGEQKVVSSISGKILTYDKRTGDMTILVSEGGDNEGENEKFLSPIDGTVTLCDNEKIVVDTKTNTFIATRSSGGSIQAEVLYIKETGDGTLPLHALTTDIIGKVILTSSLSLDGLTKAIGMDAAGILVRSLTDTDADYLAEKHASFPILQVAEDDYVKLVKWSGKQLYIDGGKKSIILLQK